MCSKQAGSAVQSYLIVQVTFYTANSIKPFFSLLIPNYIQVIQTAAFFSLCIINHHANMVIKHRLLKG